jgi:hypothetical protein
MFIETQTRRKLKILKNGNGKEFIFKEFEGFFLSSWDLTSKAYNL